MMKNKIKIGIDINEVLRSRWLQFDKYYVEEFGEEGVPKEQPYVYDFFEHYKWEAKKEINKELKEPEDMPEDINPLDYQIDKNTGEAPADFALFKLPEEKTLTAKEVYNRFMYEDFVFEIHGSAQQMYRGLDVHFSRFCINYNDNVELSIVSKENFLSIPSTLLFLSVLRPKVKKFNFAETNEDIWKDIDVLITADPELLVNIPENKKVIKVIRPFNKDIECDFEIMQVNDLNPIITIDESKPINPIDKIADNQYNKCEEFKKLINSQMVKRLKIYQINNSEYFPSSIRYVIAYDKIQALELIGYNKESAIGFIKYCDEHPNDCFFINEIPIKKPQKI